MPENDEESSASNLIDLDDILPLIGEFGMYQKLLLWLICLPACLPCGFCAFNQLFMSELPNHWCAIPELDNLTNLSLKNNFTDIFKENNLISNCYRYNTNWSELIRLINDNGAIDIDSIRTNSSIETCIDGWQYDFSTVKSSIVIDFDLVCDKSILPTIGLVALNVGGPIGVFSFGKLNDKFGRKISFFTCLIFMIAGNVLTAFSANIWFWIVSRFISGLTVPALYQIPFIIALELVGPNYRSLVTVMTCISYTIALVLLPVLVYFTMNNWRHLALITSVPFLLFYFYWCFLPESPRWLLSKGRNREALTILEKLSKYNNRPFPDKIKKLFLSKKFSTASLQRKWNCQSYGIRDLFRTANMRLKTCLITINWFANETVYVGLSYYGPMLGSNHLLNFAFSSLVEIPSYLLCWPLMDYFGRKWPLCICMVLSGIFCMITVALNEDQINLTFILYLLSKCTISASFLIIYPFAGELYPTQLRGIGIGFSSYIAGLGLIAIPFLVYLGTVNSLSFPLFVMGLISILSGISSLRLPETVRSKMPQTIEECDLVGKNWTWHDYFSCMSMDSTQNISEGDKSVDDIIELKNFEEENEDGAELMDLKEFHRNRPKNKFVRQSSLMDTQRTVDGTMKIAYWF